MELLLNLNKTIFDARHETETMKITSGNKINLREMYLISKPQYKPEYNFFSLKLQRWNYDYIFIITSIPSLN